MHVKHAHVEKQLIVKFIKMSYLISHVFHYSQAQNYV